MDFFVRGVRVGLAYTEKLLIEKLKIARETGDPEAELGEDPKTGHRESSRVIF